MPAAMNEELRDEVAGVSKRGVERIGLELGTALERVARGHDPAQVYADVQPVLVRIAAYELDRLTQERDRAREQVARVQEQIAHAQANDHHLDLTCQGVDPFQDLPPAVRIDYIKAALKERP